MENEMINENGEEIKEAEAGREAAEPEANPAADDGTVAEKVGDTDAGDEEVEVIGLKFKNNGKTYYFAPCGQSLKKGDGAIVETARGIEFGTVTFANTRVPSSQIVPPLRNVVRAATEADVSQYEKNNEMERDAMDVCRKKIEEHGLTMKLIDAEYTFDRSKLMFYFTAEVRVDFRELVKDLASVFRTRIELRQIGIRDEAKMLGGIGICGRPFCCSSFLSDFAQVSIKMAKEQNLSLNSAKISGTCGRLMCCLRFEHENYEAGLKKTPKVDAKVVTPDGEGVVAESSPLTGLVKVKIPTQSGEVVKIYDRDVLTVIKTNQK